MRFIFFILLLFVLGGCTTPLFTQYSPQVSESPPQVSAPSVQQELFLNALDQFAKTDSLSGMIKLQEQFPDTKWGRYAALFVSRTNRFEVERTRFTTERADLQQQLIQLESLRQENLQLSEQLKQLKTLLIELEQRPR